MTHDHIDAFQLSDKFFPIKNNAEKATLDENLWSQDNMDM